jgi:hypothetical protein
MSIPTVLVDPPWRKRPVEEAKVEHVGKSVAVVVDPPKPQLVWAEGEREAFRGKRGPKMIEAAEEKLFEKLLDELDKHLPLRLADVSRLGDENFEELAGELTGSTTDSQTLKLALGRLGDSFLEQAITIVRVATRERGLFEAAMPIASAELAKTAAGMAFDRAVDSAWTRSSVESWLLRHADLVAIAAQAAPDDKKLHAAHAFCSIFGSAKLEPYDALAPLADRAELLHALVFASRDDSRAMALLEQEAAAATWIAGMRAAREAKELSSVPTAVAKLPDFFDVSKIAHPHLRDGTPLPDEAVIVLGEMMRLSPLGHPYAGVSQVREACDPASLDAFALDLLARWREAGEAAQHVWAFETCGKIGSDACAREIATRVRAWARDGGTHEMSYAQKGCAVLAAIGSETSRLLLEDLARGAVQGWLRRDASVALGGEERPFDDVEAPVPDVGLDPDGSATLDTGKRVFHLALDEALTPVLVDAEGTRVASFPRARKDDDAVKHAAAKERFASIVKDAKIVARFQVSLLERMMCSQRAFSMGPFRSRFLEHPFLRHLGRRVVWNAEGRHFRIAEDGTFAGSADEHIDIGGGHVVGVVHPITMKDDEREAWIARFADYQIVQPFPQLGRELFRSTAAEIGDRTIARAAETKTTRGRLFQLGRRDWRADFRHGDMTEYTKELPCGAAARFEIVPPVTHGGDASQVFTIRLAQCTYALDRLPPIDYSELMRDLDYARVGT